jgi:hypothetical protein
MCREKGQDTIRYDHRSMRIAASCAAAMCENPRTKDMN